MMSQALVERAVGRSRAAACSEVLKWVGLACMVVDHLGRFASVPVPGWQSIGRFAFPCFGVALASQVPACRLRVVGLRLLVVGLGVVPLQSLVVGHVVLSVLFTLGLGLFVADALSGCVTAEGAVVLAGSFVASLFVEYGSGGVLLVAGGWLSYSLRRQLLGFSMLCVAFALLVRRGGAFVGLPLAAVLLYCYSPGVVVPRARHAFIWFYILQWPALLLLQRVPL